MKALILILGLAVSSAFAQLPANPSKITVEAGSGSTVTETVRSNNQTRNVHVTHNPSDTLTVINPPHMTSGMNIDKSTLPPFAPGYDTVRVRDTTEAPVPGGGAFRTVCDPALMERNDPIVYPAQPDRSHEHLFVGNKLIDAFSDATTLATTGNSTCRGGIANRSSYWVPPLYDVVTSKPFLPVSWLIYYKGGKFNQKQGYGWAGPDGVWHPAIMPWPGFSYLPQGIKLIAGDPNATVEPPANPFSMRWNCRIGGVNNFGKRVPAVCPIGATLGLEIFMPQCWDGNNLDSPDHKSHVVYPITVRNAGDSRGWSHYECPQTHPKVLPEVSYSISWDVTTDIARYRLASDVVSTNPGGWTAHGDWFMAWQQKFANMFVDNCIKAVADCHAHLLGRDPADGRLKEMY